MQFRDWLVAGLLIWLPLGVTLLILRLLITSLDQIVLLLPLTWQPKTLFGFDLPGLGLILSLVLVLTTGVLAANLIGEKILNWFEYLIERVPGVRAVYRGVRKLAETVLAEGSQSFRQVVLIEYPRAGLWTLAFQTGTAHPEVAEKIQTVAANSPADNPNSAEMPPEILTIFVPTSPNPTSGFVLFLPKNAVIPLDMPVDQGLALVLSLGANTE